MSMTWSRALFRCLTSYRLWCSLVERRNPEHGEEQAVPGDIAPHCLPAGSTRNQMESWEN